jgi:hypothetical protein
VEIAFRKVKATFPPEVKTPVPFFTPLRAAASVILLVCTSCFIFYSTQENKPAEPVVVNKQNAVVPVVIKTQTITTSDTAVSFFLPDSTHIILNKKSSLTYPENFSGDARRVTLNGEAFFEVKHNAEMPFIITAGNTETKVLGTSFNIKQDESKGNVEVSVMTGKVQFMAMENEKPVSQITLLPQERVTYSQVNASMIREKVSGKNFWWLRNLKSIRKLFRAINNPVAHK